MAKAKKKKVEVEENEFLKGLIDEVKNYEEKSAVDINDESVISFDDVMSPSLEEDEEDKKRARGIFEESSADAEYAGSSQEDNEVPTAFRSLENAVNEQSEPISLSSSDDDNMSPMQAIRAAAAKAKASTSSNYSPTSATEYPTAAIAPEPPANTQDKTVATPDAATVATNQEASRTIAVDGARRGQMGRASVQERVVAGSLKGTRNGQVYTSLDASLAQAETLKVAQDRIKELEHECDRLRQENDDLASASDVVTRRMEELQTRALKLQKEKNDILEQAKSEQLILKGNLQYKDSELAKAKGKVEDLESRLKSDFRKIRVRERELENRLELVRAEKQALMRSKDEKILDLQRKLDQFKSELDLYRAKVQDLNKSMEEQQEQMKKTVRALRVALSNLEQDELTKILSEAGESPVENLPAVPSSNDATQAVGSSDGYGQDNDEDPNKQNVG